MQVVSAVVTREQLRGAARVQQNRVEIDRAVEFTAAKDPGVDLLAHAFFLGSVKSDRRRRRPQIQKRVFEWWVGRTDDSNSLLVRPRDELAIPRDDALRLNAFCRR